MTKARRRRLLLVVGSVLAAAITAKVLVNSSDELLTAADNLSSVRPGWLVLAAAVELASYTCYAAAQRGLLRRAGSEVGLVPMTGITLFGQAAGNCLPGGLAVTAVVNYRQLRRLGVPDVETGWVLGLMSGLFMGALGAVALLAAPLAGDGGPVPALQTIALSVVGGLVLLGLVLRGLRARYAWSSLVLVLVDRVLGLPLVRNLAGVAEGSAHQRARALLFRLGRVHLRPGALVVALGWLMLSWLADAGVLGLSFLALGVAAPWRGLLLAYCAGQLAAALPFTPGGLGVVEGSLTVALVAFGGGDTSTLSAVLLYRLISFWGVLPVGGLSWLALRRALPAKEKVA